MITINIYYCIRYFPKGFWKTKKFFLERGRIVVPDNERLVVLDKNISFNGHDNLSCVNLFLIYSTCEIINDKDYIKFHGSRPMRIKKWGETSFREVDNTVFDFPFGIPDLIQEGTKDSENFFRRYIKDFEESYNDITKYFKEKLNDTIFDYDIERELINEILEGL